MTAGILGKGRGASSLAGFVWPSPGCSLCCTIPIPAWVVQPRQSLAALGGKDDMELFPASATPP